MKATDIRSKTVLILAAMLLPAVLFFARTGGLTNPIRALADAALLLRQPAAAVLIYTDAVQSANLTANASEQFLPLRTASETIPSEEQDETLTTAEIEALIPPERRGRITEVQYLSNPVGETYFSWGAGSVRNLTSYSAESLLESLAQPLEYEIEIGSRAPQVLILHTHTTESFDRFDVGFFDIEYPYRSTDPERNMLAVGAQLCETLNENGICAIQAAECHDYPSYDGAYYRSADTVLSYLEEYPSIRIVIDLHRDGIEDESGARIKPTVRINGRKAAQIMIISNADDGSLYMPEFRENLKLAVRIQDSAETLWPGLTRPILFDYRSYNQELSTGSLLIEIGSHGNTLEEALWSAELLGEAIADALKKL